jgi:TonB family protein
MKKGNFFSLLLILTLFLMQKCSIPEQEFIVDTPPQILVKTTLPPINQYSKGQYFKLETRIFIEEDGSVKEVKLLNSNQDKDWDARAISEIKKWRFSPAIYQGKPIAIWVKQPIQVQMEFGNFILLSEIECNNLEQADTVYSKLLSGENFKTLVDIYSISDSKKSNGILGSVDIKKYPQNIQDTLINLKDNQITKPLQIDGKYYIFKRSINP